MKKWKVMAAGLVTLSVLTAGLTASSAVSAAEIRKADSSVFFRADLQRRRRRACLKSPCRP